MKEKRIVNFIFIILSLIILISIKPYLFIAIFPGSILWYTFHVMKQVKGSVIKVIYFPIALLFGGIIGFGIFSSLDSQFGKYQLTGLLDQAIVIQEDLTRDVYGKNSFDVGEIDGSVSGMLSKAPIAISAALFRPFIWEIKNPAMFLSGIENAIVLVIFIIMLIKIRMRAIIRIIFDQPIILFSLIFSFFLAYSVGISTANFGALVRYKIPIIPYFVSSILIIQYYYKFGDSEEMKKEMTLD